MKEKRKFPRLGQIWELDYRKISSDRFDTNLLSSFTVNVSGGGICIEAGEEIPKGTVLALELKSTIFPSHFIALGKAVWCEKEKKKDIYVIGVEFLWTGWKDKEVQSKLAEYILKQIS